MVLLCKVALCSAVQIEAIAESLLEIPQGVNHRIDWTDNVISHWVEFGAPVRGLSRVPTADSYCREATDRLAVGQNADGRLEIFARGADGKQWLEWLGLARRLD